MSETTRSEPAAPAVGSQVDRGVRPLPTSAAVATIYPRDFPHVDVLSWRRRPKTAGEYLLYTEDQLAAAVAAERERWLSPVLAMRGRLLQRDPGANTSDVDALLSGPNVRSNAAPTAAPNVDK